jgi:hypothetical protein
LVSAILLAVTCLAAAAASAAAAGAAKNTSAGSGASSIASAGSTDTTTGSTKTAANSRASHGSSDDREMPVTASARFQPSTIAPGGTAVLKIKVEVAAGYHAYVDKFKIAFVDSGACEGATCAPAENEATKQRGLDLKLDRLRISPIKVFQDPFTHSKREVIEGKAEINATVEAPSLTITHYQPTSVTGRSALVQMNLLYQACTQDHCLFLKSVALSAPLTVN